MVFRVLDTKQNTQFHYQTSWALKVSIEGYTSVFSLHAGLRPLEYKMIILSWYNNTVLVKKSMYILKMYCKQ